MNRRNVAAACGLAAPIVAAAAILAATLLDPAFAWTTSALSDTGALPAGRSVSLSPSLVRSSPQVPVFNGGLIATGLLGLPFAWRLWTAAEHVGQRAGAAWYALAVVFLGLVGVFPLPHPLHGPVAVGHFATATVALWVYGSGTVLAGRPRAGLATIWLGIGHVLVWIGWALALASGPVPGIAIPETVGAAIFGGWTVARARSLLGRSS